MTTKRRVCKSFIKAFDDQEGTVDKVVSVFEVVDYANDRVKAGAFSTTLKRWDESGDPIPVIFSHQWDNLDAHVGKVVEARELAPGDELLPDEIKDYGGLFVREQYDMDWPFAKRLYQLQKERRIKESSFAYDIVREKKAKDGANDLLELDLIEVGPTLKGMNPLTQLLSVKEMPKPDDPRVRRGAKVGRVLSTKNEEKLSNARDLIDEVLESVGDDSKSRGFKDRKAYVALPGTYEDRQQRLYEALRGWANDTFGDNTYCSIEGTYDDRVIFSIRSYDDEWVLEAEGNYETTYSIGDEAVEIGEPREVEFELTVTSKGGDGPTKAVTVKAEEPDGEKAEERALKPEDVRMLSELEEMAI